MTDQQPQKQSVLLVVDVQVGVMRQAWNSERVINNICRLVEKARASRVPVIWVQHSDEDLSHGSPEWGIIPDLHPEANEIQMEKSFNSAFEGTSLHQTLTQMGINHIILAGAASNWCIRATAHGALDRGYHLTLVSDAHTTESLEFDDGSITEASDLVQELNAAMEWLSYPGNLNRVAKTHEVAFPTLG